MNISEIEGLLEKYYEGLTSIEEEEKLKKYFNNGIVPFELKEHVHQFRYYSSVSDEVMPNDEFEKNLLNKLETPILLHIKNNRQRNFSFLAIAAGFLLLAGLIFTIKEEVFKHRRNDIRTVTPEVALLQTKEILLEISVQFNKGMNKVEYLGKFDNAIQKVNYLSKYYQYQTLVINPDLIHEGP